jgi:hypothetical protein
MPFRARAGLADDLKIVSKRSGAGSHSSTAPIRAVTKRESRPEWPDLVRRLHAPPAMRNQDAAIFDSGSGFR